MNNLSGDLVGGNSLFELSCEWAADNIPLLVVALAVGILLFLLWRKLINIPAAVLFVLSVIGISLDLIQRFNGNNISSIYLPEWLIFLIGQLSYSILVGVFIWIVFSYYYEKKRKDIYKNRLSVAYDYFKENIIEILLFASEGMSGPDLVENLSYYENFQKYFDYEKKCLVVEQLDNEKQSFRRDLVDEFELFQKEISNILNANILPNEESYNALRNMSGRFSRIKLAHDNIVSDIPKGFGFYEFDKSFMREVFSTLSQWNIIDGQLKEDPTKKIIEKI